MPTLLSKVKGVKLILTHRASDEQDPQPSEVRATVDFVEAPGRFHVCLEALGFHFFEFPRLEHIFDKDLRYEDLQGNHSFEWKMMRVYPRLFWPRTYKVVWPDGRGGRIAIFDDGRLCAWDGPTPLLGRAGVNVRKVVAPTLWERLAAF